MKKGSNAIEDAWKRRDTNRLHTVHAWQLQQMKDAFEAGWKAAKRHTSRKRKF